MIPGRSYTAAELLQIILRRKWLVLVPLVTIGAGTYAVTRVLPDRFRSETLILVVPQRVPDTYVRATVTAKIEDRLSSIQQQILSRSRLERIILDFDLYSVPRRTQVMEDVVVRMREDIGPLIVEGDTFRVSYEGDSPVVAQAVTQRLAALFIEENLRDRETLAADTSAFLESQLEDARQRLVEQEKKLEQFRKEHSGELPSQADAIIQAIQNRQLQVQSLVDSVARDRDRRIIAERLRADLTPESLVAALPAAPAAAGDTLAAPDAPASLRLDLAQKALRDLQARFTPEHPDVRRLQRTVESLEKEAEAEAASPSQARESRVLSPAELSRRNRLRELDAEILNLDRQIAYKQAEEKRLRDETEKYQRHAAAIPTRESELVALTRDYDTIRESYQSLLKKKEDSKLAENLERRQIGEQFRVLDPARAPEKPYRPNRPLINLIGTLAGLGFGVLLTAGTELLDARLHNEADVHAALRLPVLATVPVIRSAADRRRARRVRVLTSVAAVLIAVCVAGVVLALSR